MRLKTILAKNFPEAMRRVREQLGDDAVIVQTEETDGGVMVMAATDSDPSPMAPAGAGRDVALAGEDPWHELPSDPTELLSEALDYHRAPPAVAASLLSASASWDHDDPVAAMAGALRARFTFRPIDPAETHRPIFLVGPAGAGKTITAAKLATAAILARCTPALVCADTERAGGAQQLGAFAGALKLDMLRARTEAELRDCLIAADGRRPIIIDGAAFNPLDPASARRVMDMAAAIDAEPLLVLPAGLDAAEAEDMARLAEDLGVERFIATRMDASRRLGSLLSAAAAGLSPAAFGISPRIVDGLRSADPESLARALLNEITTMAPSSQTRRSQETR